MPFARGREAQTSRGFHKQRQRASLCRYRPWPPPLMIGFRRRGGDRKLTVVTGLPHGHVVAVCTQLLTRASLLADWARQVRRYWNRWTRRHVATIKSPVGTPSPTTQR